MFCERCARLTRNLTYDSSAEPRAELMSGSCIWPDEIHRDWCTKCIWWTREVFHLRYQLTIGKSVPPEAMAYFDELQHEFPNWPLFRPERRSPDIAKRVRNMVRRNARRACADLDRMDREFRTQQGEGRV